MDRMNYWVDQQIGSQRVASRTSSFSSVRELSIELIGSSSDVRRRGGLMPSWVILGMIILAAVSVCVTVTIRTRAQSQVASHEYTRIVQDVDSLRLSNEALKTEIRQLRGDANAIESAARSRLNMARPNEIIVPDE